jgi:hypothetical protein
MTVGEAEDSKKADKTRVSDDSADTDSHPASLHSDSHMARTMQVTNRTLTSEPSSLNTRRKAKPKLTAVPEPVPLTERPEAVTDRFERACGAYQRQNVIFAIGELPPARKLFRKKSVNDQIGVVANIDNVLKASKAQYARWKNTPENERTAKPKVPSLRAVIGFELWKEAGIPSEPGPAATLLDEHIDLCREIAKNSTFGTVWITAGSPKWNAWHGFFKLHGQGMSKRKANFADCYDAKAEKGSEGWRFPSEWPPSTGDPPTAPIAHNRTDDFADLHYGSR